jgi:hypothetical protein
MMSMSLSLLSAANEAGGHSDQMPRTGQKPAGPATLFTSHLRDAVDLIRSLSRKIFTPMVLFLLILAVGIFSRVWEYDQLPPGLNQDEASIGVEAYDLLHFGVDRNGVSLPVNFISWGSGQNALYGYLLMPFIAVGGLTTLTVRLPMLLTGILTLPLVFFVAKRTLNIEFALLAMFLLAICPWHILLSRWGLESNILPFTFLLSYACLLKSTTKNYWFILSCFFSALSLYAYGPAYAAVPIFILVTIAAVLFFKRASRESLFAGLIVFVMVSLPIGLLVLINSLHLNSIHLGLFTIPRYPAQARYEEMSLVFNRNGFDTMLHNLGILLSLLLKQDDGLIWNTVRPFGYFYVYTLPLAIIGGIQILLDRKSAHRMEQILLMGWITVSLLTGILQEVNVNRINLLFIPLLLCMAFPLEWLRKHLRILYFLAIFTLLIGFSFFTERYHGPDYRQQADRYFFTGLLPALEHAGRAVDQPVCVTDRVNMPYIFVLFSDKPDPATYLKTIQYDDPYSSFRKVISLGRYTFGLANCPADPRTVYVLSGEDPPANGILFSETTYGRFQVYAP